MIQLLNRWSASKHLSFSPAALLTLLLCYLLSSCSSIPLSTMAKFHRFGPEHLIHLQADEIRVRLKLPRQAELDPERTELQLYIASAERQYDEKFTVRLISQTMGYKDDGWFSPPVPVQSFVFELSDSSKQKFRELQQHLIVAAKPDQYIFSASSVLTNLSPEFDSVRMWVDLQLSDKEGFSPLIDGAIMDFNLTENTKATTE